MTVKDIRKAETRKSPNTTRLKARLNRLFDYEDADSIAKRFLFLTEHNKAEAERFNAFVSEHIKANGRTLNTPMKNAMKWKIDCLAKDGSDWEDVDIIRLMELDEIFEHFLDADWDVQEPSSLPRNVLGLQDA